VSRLALLIFAIDKRRDDPDHGMSFARNIVVTAGYLLACIVPSWFSVIAYVLGAFCFVATGLAVASATERLR